MSDPNQTRSRNYRHQYLVAIDGSLALTAVLLVVQMWLLTASLEAYLSGHREAVIPGAIFSGILFAGTVALYLFVRKLESAAKNKGL
jgi:hypothetical protein